MLKLFRTLSPWRLSWFPMLRKESKENREPMVAENQSSRDNYNWVDRAHETGESPYPIEYTVNELIDLLTPKNLPDIEEDVLNAKRSMLREAYFKYCGTLPGCSSPNIEGNGISP